MQVNLSWPIEAGSGRTKPSGSLRLKLKSSCDFGATEYLYTTGKYTADFDRYFTSRRINHGAKFLAIQKARRRKKERPLIQAKCRTRQVGDGEWAAQWRSIQDLEETRMKSLQSLQLLARQTLCRECAAMRKGFRRKTPGIQLH
jgi:hypothetical protein